MACWESSMLQRIANCQWCSLLTCWINLPFLLSRSWQSHSINWFQRIHTYQIFKLIEILESMVNFILINIPFDITVHFVPQLWYFLDRDESTMLRQPHGTSNLVEGFVVRLFHRSLFAIKILLASLFPLFWLFCLRIGRISANTFDVDILPFLTRELFFLKTWEVYLLKLVLRVCSFWRSWESNHRSLFKSLFGSMRRRHKV